MYGIEFGILDRFPLLQGVHNSTNVKGFGDSLTELST